MERSVLVLAFALAAARAEEPLQSVVDSHVAAQWKAEGVTPAERADDATIIRRTTLDLIGRIPTLPEVEAFLASKDADKRAKLVDRLMSSPAYARHQAAQFEWMLTEGNPAGGKKGNGPGSLREYLVRAVQSNKAWDAMFRDLMLPDDADPKLQGASDFLRPKLADADRLANDVSVAFFGVNIGCAQCHDHPLVGDWKQDHFFGMKSFLARTYDAGGFVAERDAGLVKFKPTKGPEKQAKLMFLTGATVETDTLRELSKDEQKREKEAAEKAKTDKKAAPPKPKFSARAELVRIALQKTESEYFSKAIVNRLWHRFFGYGLVNPLDQMHSENPPSHPELLAALAEDTASHGYDLRRLTRALVLSDAYGRSSRFSSGSQPAASTFAVMRLKPLTPMQLATSLKIATTDPKQWDGLSNDEFEERIEAIENSARGFAPLIAQPTDNFQIGVAEALLFSNGDRIAKDYLTDGAGSLLGRLKAEKQAETLLLRTALGRAPTDREREALAAFAATRHDRLDEARRDMLWAIVTGPEFRFCH